MDFVAREMDDEGRPKYLYKDALEVLAEELVAERCLFFLGAGASINSSDSEADLPTAQELSKFLADQCRLAWHDYIPLSTIAFYYEFFRTRKKLDEVLTQRIGGDAIPPPPTIRTLVKLIALLEQLGKRTFTITTNYDRHFERAYREEVGIDPAVIIYKGATDPHDHAARLHFGIGDRRPLYWLPDPRQRTYIYKMHGCISQPENHGLVITEEDYINFLTNTMSQNENKRLLNYVLGQIAMCTILFVGYSLTDWNFRVIYKATVETSEGKDGRSYAVQFRPAPTAGAEDFERARWDSASRFWATKNVQIINADATAFLGDLLDIVRTMPSNRGVAAAGRA